MLKKFSSVVLNFMYLTLLMISVGCGAFVSSTDPINPNQLTFTNLVAVNPSNITNFPIGGNCSNSAGGVEVRFGNPILFSVTLPCANRNFSGTVDLTSIGLTEGPNTLWAVQGDETIQVTVDLIVDTTAPSAPDIFSPTDGSTLVSVFQTITGSCENGARLNISGNVTSQPADVICSGGIYFEEIRLTSGNGLKTIVVSQTDTSGNTSPNESITVTLDTTVLAPPPAPFIASPASGSLTNSISQVIQGTCETGADVSIAGNINASPVVVTCANGNFARAVTLTSADGSKIIDVTQTNATATSTSATLSLTLDATTPLAPTITSPANNSTTNQVAQSITGACETGTTVRFQGSFVGSPLTANCSGGAYTRAITLAGGDGPKNIAVSQTDSAGNTSLQTNLLLNLLTGLPAVPTVASPVDSSFTNQIAQTLTGSCITGFTVNVSGAGVAGGPFNVLCANNAFSQNINLTAGQGVKNISVTQTDMAMNTSPATAISITLDSQIPNTPTITSPMDGLNTNQISQTLTGSCETGARVNFTGNFVGSPTTIFCAGGNYSRAISLSGSDGAKNISVSQIDLAGNTSNSVSLIINLLTAPPPAPTITAPANNSLTNQVSQTVTGVCVTGNTVNISGAGVVGGPVNVMCAGNSYSRAINLTAGQGVKVISVTQTNSVTTVSSAATVSVTFDSVAPAAPTVSSPASGSTLTVVAQTVVGTCETGATLNITGNIVSAPATATCSGGNYSRAVTISGADGAKNISVTQTDLAGNTSMAVSVAFDLLTGLPPAPTITAPLNNSFTNLLAQTIAGECVTGNTVNIGGTGIAGGPVSVLCASNAYSQNVNLTSSQGLKNISVTQRNPALSVSPAAVISITFDSFAPFAPTITAPANGANTNQTAQTVTGTCETGATVNVSGNIVGSPVTAPCAGGNFTRAVALAGADGAKTINVSQTDFAGNISSVVSRVINLLTSLPPAPTITSPLNNSFSNQTVELVTGLCVTGNTVIIGGSGVAGGPINAVCAGNTYSQNINFTSGQGVKNISVTQRDSALNVSPATNIAITLDSVAPAAPSIGSPVNGSNLNQVAQTVTGTCETGATVNVLGNIVGFPVTATCTGGNYSRAVTISGADGAKSISVTQTDLAGNTSVSVAISVNLVTGLPPVPAITSPLNNSFTNQTVQTVTGECVTGNNVSVGGTGIIGGPISLICVGNTYSQNVNLTAGQGVKNISVTQTDQALNVSPASVISITFDSTAPAAPTITSPADGANASQIAQTIVGTCGTGNTVNLSGNIVGSPVTTSCVGGNYSRSITLAGADGPKTINVTQTDSAGNTSSAVSRVINLLTGLPPAPTITAPLNNSLTNLVAQTVTGVCTTGYTVSIAGPGVASAPINVVCSNNAYSRNINLSSGQGVKSISVTQTDLASNVSPAADISVTFDSTAPAAPTIATPTNGSNLNQASQSVAGTCETGATVNVSGNIVGSPVTALCTGGNYSRVVTLSGADGAKNISATQTDLAGNTSTSVNISVNLITGVPPAPTITSPLNNSLTNQVAQTITGACVNGNTVNISGAGIAGGPINVVCAGNGYSRNINLSAGQGVKNINVTQTDAGLNVSPAAAVVITFDSIAPTAPTISSPANGSNSGQVAQTIVGSCETGATVNVSGSIVGSPLSATCSGGNYSRAVTLLAGVGAKNINVTQTDLAGNTSSQTSITINLISVAPPAPTIASPTNGSFVNQISLTVSGGCGTGNTVNIGGTGIAGGPISVACSANSFAQTVNLTAGQGLKNISVTQTSPALDVSPATAISVTFDTVAPSAPVITSPADGSTTDQVAQTVAGTCETGATVNIVGTIVGSPVATNCAGGNFSRAVTLSGADGVKIIGASQVDSAGNTSFSDQISINLLSGLPAAPTIVSPTNGSFTNQVSQTISGICVTGHTVSVSGSGIVGGPFTSVCANSAFARAVNLTAGQGSKTINVTQTDLNLNVSPAAVISITFDIATPNAPTITSPTNGSNADQIAQTVLGTCETGSTVNVSGNIVGAPVTANCVSGNYTRNILFSGADGVKNINVTQTDSAGNTSSSVAVSVNLNTGLPPAPTITSLIDGSSTGSIVQEVAGQCVTGYTVSIAGSGIVGGPFGFTCNGSTYSQIINLTPGEGVKNITVTQRDLSLNISPAVQVFLTYDTTDPLVPTIVSPVSGSLTNQLIQTVQGECENEASVNIAGNIVGGFITVTCSGRFYSGVVTLTSGDGSKTLGVQQTDLAGNDSLSTSIVITLNTVAPPAPTIVSPSNGLITNDTSQTVSGACITGNTVVLSGSISNSPLIAQCTGSSYSRNVNLTSANGTKNIAVTQTNSIGNTSSAATLTINLDTIAPAAPTISSPAEGVTVDQAAQNVVGTCVTGSTVNVSGTIVGSPVTVVCTASAYTRAVTLSGGDGPKNIVVSQTDLAGNISSTNEVNFNLISGLPPVPTVTSITNGAFTNQVAQTIAGACVNGNTVNISGAGIVGGPFNTTCSGNSYSQNVNLTAGQGVKNISVTQTDTGLNVSPANAISLTFDSVAPTVVVSSSSSSPTVNNPINFTFTFSENITGFVQSDIVVTNGSLTGFVGGPSVFTVNVIPTAVGNVSVRVPLSVAIDQAGNSNQASNTLVINYQLPATNIFRFRMVLPSAQTVTLPLKPGFNYNFQLDWGDGSQPVSVTSEGSPNKTKSLQAGTYDVEITGTVQAWGSDTSECYITEVFQMGFMGWTDLSYAFQGCPIVNIGVSNGSEFANVTNMAGMFYEAETANPNTTNWQTQNVTNMSVMFFGALSANPVVSGWNVSSVTDMSGMFAGAVLANPNVSNWNVSNVTNMQGMFFTALSANPDTRLWNVQSVTNFEGIFSKEEGVLQASSLSNLNYSRFLVMVEDTSPFNNLIIGPVESAFQPFAAAARSSLISRGWFIMDEGPE